jgi:phage/plasmid primase-like uncharacterized protein
VRFASVFHVSQLEGDIPPLGPPRAPDWSANDKAEAILANSGAAIKHNQRNRAFYSLRQDEICMPAKDHFPSAEDYYATALHELGHWTGHESRLNREFGPFGSEVYAREELRAEIGSWMLGMDLGTGHDPSQHLSYVDNWIEVLEKDPFEIVRACRDAERIKHYILGLEQKKEAEHVQTQEEPREREDHREAAMGPPPASNQASRPAAERTFLAVPYRQKNQAKAAGAKWDPKAKLWYAPEGADLDKLKTWLPDKAPEPAHTLSPQAEFAQALKDMGLDLGGELPVMDGKMRRVPLLDGAQGKPDGAYVGYMDGVPAGFIQNHKTGARTNWKATGHVLSDEQKAALRAEAEKRRAEKDLRLREQHEKASKRSFAKFINAREAGQEQPYLAAKGVPALGARVDKDGALLVPGHDASNHIHTLQRITPEGKQFEAGSRKNGCFFAVDPEQKLGQDGEPILIAEGFATAASVHLATGKPVAAAFDAGNLKPVAESLRAKYPEAPIAILADNDHQLETNVGMNKAVLAAKAVQGSVVVPELSVHEKAKGLTDFNDVHQNRGLEGLKAQLEAHLSKDRLVAPAQQKREAAQEMEL